MKTPGIRNRPSWRGTIGLKRPLQVHALPQCDAWRRRSDRARHPMIFPPIRDLRHPSVVFDVAAASVDPCDRPVREPLVPSRKLPRRLGVSDPDPDGRISPSVTVATVPQRAMHRLQYPCICRSFGIFADMKKIPRSRLTHEPISFSISSRRYQTISFRRVPPCLLLALVARSGGRLKRQNLT